MSETIDAFRALGHVRQVDREHFHVDAFGAFELFARRHFDGSFAGDVGHQEIHGDVLAVHVVVDPRFDVARHRRRVDVVVVAMIEGGSGQHHRYIVGPFRFVLPTLVATVPDVRSRWITHNAIWKLAPNFESEFQLVGSQHDDIIVHGQNGIRLDFGIRVESIAQLVAFGAHNLQKKKVFVMMAPQVRLIFF